MAAEWVESEQDDLHNGKQYYTRDYDTDAVALGDVRWGNGRWNGTYSVKGKLKGQLSHLDLDIVKAHLDSCAGA